MIDAKSVFFYSRKQHINLFQKILKKSYGGLDRSPKGRREPFENGKTNSIQFTTNDWSLRWRVFKLISKDNQMTHSDLIPVFSGQISNQQAQLANARELHSFLESKYQYTDWIKTRIAEYGFQENEDYIIVTELTNGRPRKEYHITLDMGKELAMVERNEKGRKIRKYFIECERQVLQKTEQIAPLAEPNKRNPLIIIRKDSSELKLFLRLLSHAHEYNKIQEAIRNGTTDHNLLPVYQHLLYRHDNGDGFMFSFKANVQSDLDQASNLIAHIV